MCLVLMMAGLRFQEKVICQYSHILDDLMELQKPKPIEGEEPQAAQTYILLNCNEVTPYIK